MTLTGDIHAAGVADLTVEDENGLRTVATELVTSPSRPCATCRSEPKRSWPSSPMSSCRRHEAGLGAQHGHADAWDAEYRAVENIADPASPVTVAARFRIDAGTPGARRLDG